MTDRVHALTIILERDVRDDDLQPLIEAIKQLRGVLEVKTRVSDLQLAIAEERARAELGKKIVEVIYGGEEMKH